MKKAAAAALYLFFLTGCGPATRWVHPDKPGSAFKKDQYYCQKTAEQSAANWGVRGNPFTIAIETEKCLDAEGWYREAVR